MIDSSMGDFGHMDHPLNSADVNESSEIEHPRHFTIKIGARLDFRKRFLLFLLLFFLKQSPARNEDIPPPLFDFLDAELVSLADMSFGLVTVLEIDLTDGAESANPGNLYV